jgi:glycosyltransferase involved in cell wall biosynthesis
MAEPACSVIIPTYNRLPYLRKAIATVIAQTFGDWELLVVDDGSTDDTFAAISALSLAEPRLRILLNSGSSGPAGARNAAIVEARGLYIAFLDSDDLWDEDKLAQFMEVAGAEPDAILIGSDYRMVDEVSNTSRTACDMIYKTMMPWWETYARTVDLLPCRELRQDRSLLARSDVVFATTIAGFLFIDRQLATHDITGRNGAAGERYQSHAGSRRHDEYADWKHQLALMQRIREQYTLSSALNSLMEDRLDYFHKNCARAAWRAGRRTIWLKHWIARLRCAIMRRIVAS